MLKIQPMASANSQKVAIVTGGSSGIGRATVVALAKEEGAKVVVAARREKEGEETAQLVKKAGSDSIFVKTDVTNEDDVRALVDKRVKKYGRLDYAFNNAGFDEAETSLVETPLGLRLIHSLLGAIFRIIGMHSQWRNGDLHPDMKGHRSEDFTKLYLAGGPK
jgi:NAD(P)-dependent dehydrogenase (short-subunit alcohol dehydrogenase family)